MAEHVYEELVTSEGKNTDIPTYIRSSWFFSIKNIWF